MAKVDFVGFAAFDCESVGSAGVFKVRVGEKYYDSKKKEKVTRWWNILFKDPDNRFSQYIKKGTYLVVQGGDLSVDIYKEELQYSCWCGRDQMFFNNPKGEPARERAIPTQERQSYNQSDDDISF